MRRTLAFLAFIGLITVVTPPVRALPPAHFWSRGFGTAGEQSGQAIAVDASGNVIMAANFSGAIDVGGGTLTALGSGDIVLAKYTANGVHVWSVRLGGFSYDDARGVGVDASGNIFLIGYFLGTTDVGGGPLASAGGDDIVLAKFGADGVHQWSQRFGSTTNDFGYSVAVDGLGNVFATGSFGNVVDFGGGPLASAGGNDIFLAKYDTNGLHVWSNRYGSTGAELAYVVAVDGALAPIITGYCEGTVDFGGGGLGTFGAYDVFLAKFDANGAHQWSQRFGGINYDFGYAVAMDAAGNVLATGSFNGTIDFGGGPLVSASFTDDAYLVRFNSAGTHVWSKRLGGTGFDYGISVAMDGAGTSITTGVFAGTADFGGGNLTSAGSSDIFLAGYDADGAHLWSRRSGGIDFDSFPFVTTDAEGSVVTTGKFQATGDFGGDDLVSAGGFDVFLAKYGNGTEPPVITDIADIGNDQGRKVKIRFDRSAHDQSASLTPVQQYEAYRRDDAPPAGALVWRDPAALSPRALLAEGWTQVGVVAAHEESSYGIDVPTIGDSTLALGQYHSVFYVRAATGAPGTFFDSPADSGYSLDNLAPGAPASLLFSSGVLSWNESTAEDFDYFTVYGADTDDFGSATVVDYSVPPSMDVSGAPYVYYFVTATDFSGNEGSAAKINTLSNAGGTPRSYVLSVSNFPNPFNPRTTVSYTVPSRAPVTVAIYDARGARVATLVSNEVREAGAYALEWSGRSDSGAAVPSGVYFARIEQAGAVRTKKMVLLK